MRQIFPEPGPTSITTALDSLDRAELGARAGTRPYVLTNFASTIDGHATIDGVSGKIGSDTDTEMLMGLRSAVDAVMIGAGTMRTERYGRMVPSAERRELRVRRGLAPDPLAVIVSGTLDLPWEAGLFTCGEGAVVVVTTADADPPPTATPVELIRQSEGIDLAGALRELRDRSGVELLLSEGGPHLHGDLLAAGLVDELFVTLAPKLGWGAGPRIVEGGPGGPTNLEPIWVLDHDGEFFCRYRVSPA